MTAYEGRRIFHTAGQLSQPLSIEAFTIWRLAIVTSLKSSGDTDHHPSGPDPQASPL